MSMFCFFSSRRRSTSLVSDWSSDVCSSDLRRPPRTARPAAAPPRSRLGPSRAVVRRLAGLFAVDAAGGGLVTTGFLSYYLAGRSEERRVGEECRAQGSLPHVCSDESKNLRA